MNTEMQRKDKSKKDEEKDEEKNEITVSTREVRIRRLKESIRCLQVELESLEGSRFKYH